MDIQELASQAVYHPSPLKSWVTELARAVGICLTIYILWTYAAIVVHL